MHLQAQFKCRTTEKRYTALVQGIPPAAMRLEHRLGRHPVHRKKQAVVKKEGRMAISQVYREAVFGAVAQVGVEIETGRTHQIRVQMAHMGHAVLGDALYSPRKKVFSGGSGTADVACESAFFKASGERKALLLCGAFAG